LGVRAKNRQRDLNNSQRYKQNWSRPPAQGKRVRYSEKPGSGNKVWKNGEHDVVGDCAKIDREKGQTYFEKGSPRGESMPRSRWGSQPSEKKSRGRHVIEAPRFSQSNNSQRGRNEGQQKSGNDRYPWKGRTKKGAAVGKPWPLRGGRSREALPEKKSEKGQGKGGRPEPGTKETRVLKGHHEKWS